MLGYVEIRFGQSTSASYPKVLRAAQQFSGFREASQDAPYNSVRVEAPQLSAEYKHLRRLWDGISGWKSAEFLIDGRPGAFHDLYTLVRYVECADKREVSPQPRPLLREVPCGRPRLGLPLSLRHRARADHPPLQLRNATHRLVGLRRLRRRRALRHPQGAHPRGASEGGRSCGALVLPAVRLPARVRRGGLPAGCDRPLVLERVGDRVRGPCGWLPRSRNVQLGSGPWPNAPWPNAGSRLSKTPSTDTFRKSVSTTSAASTRSCRRFVRSSSCR